MHGLLFPGRQDLAAALSAQPVRQWLLEVARLVSFSDNLASSWFARCGISRALGVPGLLCQERLVYSLYTSGPQPCGTRGQCSCERLMPEDRGGAEAVMPALGSGCRHRRSVTGSPRCSGVATPALNHYGTNAWNAVTGVLAFNKILTDRRVNERRRITW